MSYTALLTTPGTCTPSLSLTQSSSPYLTSTFQRVSTLCRYLQHHLSGALAEPKQLAEHKDHSHFTEDNQLVEYQDLAEHEDLRVKPLFFHQPSIASTYDSAESIVTPPPDWDLDDEEREASADDHKFITLHEKTSCPVHLKIR